MGLFGGGLSSTGSPGTLAASSERLLIGGRTAGRCTLMSGLSSVLKRIAHTKFTEWCVALTEAASVASLCSGCVTDDASCTVETAQLPNACWEQFLSSVFLTHVLHETLVRGCFVRGGIWTALRTTKVLL